MRCNSPIYLRDKSLIIPCGHCIACRINKREEWCTRLLHEASYSFRSIFITLTYDDAHLPLVDSDSGDVVPVVSKIDIQDFIKVLRRKSGSIGIRYFIGSEYGPSGKRPHYHGFLFNVPAAYSTKQVLEEDIWKRGFVTVGEVTRSRCNYAAKYYVERDWSPCGSGVGVPFTLMSRRPGIGRQFVEDNRFHLDNPDVSTCNRNGREVPLPRYYRNLAYSDDVKQVRLQRFYSTQDIADFQRRNSGLGGELESIMVNDYKLRHKKEL